MHSITQSRDHVGNDSPAFSSFQSILDAVPAPRSNRSAFSLGRECRVEVAFEFAFKAPGAFHLH